MKDHNLVDGIEMPLARYGAGTGCKRHGLFRFPSEKQQEIIGRTHSIQSKQRCTRGWGI